MPFKITKADKERVWSEIQIAMRKSYLFPGEEQAIREVLSAGRRFGYGNMIGYLQREWDATIEAQLPRRRPRKGKTK